MYLRITDLYPCNTDSGCLDMRFHINYSDVQESNQIISCNKPTDRLKLE